MASRCCSITTRCSHTALSSAFALPTPLTHAVGGKQLDDIARFYRLYASSPAMLPAMAVVVEEHYKQAVR